MSNLALPRLKRPPPSVLRGLALPALQLLTWEIASHAGLVNAPFLPPVESVLVAA